MHELKTIQYFEPRICVSGSPSYPFHNGIPECPQLVTNLSQILSDQIFSYLYHHPAVSGGQ